MESLNLEAKLALLKQVSLFANIEDSKLKLLAFTSESVTFDRGQTLFRQGGPSDVAYVIVEGQAEAVWEGDGGATVLARLGRCDVSGEIALLSDVPSMTTVTAKSPVVALRLEKDVFVRLIEEYPQIAVAIIRELARVIHGTTHERGAANAARRRTEDDRAAE